MLIKYFTDKKNRKCASFNDMIFIKESSGYYKINTNWNKKIKNSYRLHQAVYEFHKGKIPKGFLVHHKDGNKENNKISNLELLSSKEHFEKHRDDERIKKWQKAGIKKAAIWHKTSPNSSEVHSKASIKGWKNIKPYKHKCIQCGKEFETKTKECKFCSSKCKNDYKLGYSLLEIKNIEYVGKHNVYNMEVEETHNFSVEGGIIIHNSLDALRYVIYTMIPSWRTGVENKQKE